MLGKLTFCISVCNNCQLFFKGGKKKKHFNAKTKQEPKSTQIDKLSVPKALDWKLQNSLGVLIPLSHETGFQLRPFLHNLLQKSFFRCGF